MFKEKSTQNHGCGCLFWFLLKLTVRKLINSKGLKSCSLLWIGLDEARLSWLVRVGLDRTRLGWLVRVGSDKTRLGWMVWIFLLSARFDSISGIRSYWDKGVSKDREKGAGRNRATANFYWFKRVGLNGVERVRLNRVERVRLNRFGSI